MTKTQQQKLNQIKDLIPEMDKLFKTLYRKFLAAPILSRDSIPKTPGVYAFYKNGKPIYVGRANNIKKRIYGHTRPSSGHYSANFAFNLAKLELTERLSESKIGRKALMEDEDFVKRFFKFKSELFASNIRCIEIENDIIQTMFEPYLALKLNTYPVNNNFDNH